MPNILLVVGDIPRYVSRFGSMDVWDRKNPVPHTKREIRRRSQIADCMSIEFRLGQSSDFRPSTEHVIFVKKRDGTLNCMVSDETYFVTPNIQITTPSHVSTAILEVLLYM